jgi:hypothetical protein
LIKGNVVPHLLVFILLLAIALALDASRNAKNKGDGDIGGQLFFIVTGLVSMTLLFNGTIAGKAVFL